MRLLLRLLKHRLPLFFITILMGVCFVASNLWWNFNLKDMINSISEGKPLGKEAIIISIVAVILLCVFEYLRSYLGNYTCEMLLHELRMGYARYFSHLPLSEVEQLNTGEQLSKLQNEVADVAAYLNGNLFRFINDSISFIFTLSWLLMLNPKLTLMVNLPALLIVGYVFFSSRVISGATERSQCAKVRMNRHADTLLALFPVIKLYDGIHMVSENYRREVSEWEHETVRVERLRARLLSLSGLLSQIPLMLLFLIGGGLVINDMLLLGTLYIFLNLSGDVSGVMMNMPGLAAGFRQFTVNMDRLSSSVIV